MNASQNLKPEDFPDRRDPSHVTRFSDASTFDEICINCGARDVSGGGWGTLRMPCLKAGESMDHAPVIIPSRKPA